MRSVHTVELKKMAMITCLLMFVHDSQAACPDRTDALPARLIQNPEQINLINELVPKWNKGEAVRLIKFSAYVTSDGDLVRICCVSDTHKLSATRSRRLLRLLPLLKFTPARHNDENLDVYVGFSIVAKITPEGDINTVLLMNKLVSVDLFGMNYFAPQRVWTGSMWRNSYSGSYLARIALIVDEHGAPSNVLITHTNRRDSKMNEHFVEEMQGECFIPGFVDGKATRMPYTEVFYRF